jgi:hypothetical protein
MGAVRLRRCPGEEALSWFDRWSPWRLRVRLALWEHFAREACVVAAPYTHPGREIVACGPVALEVQFDLLVAEAAAVNALRTALRLADECKDQARVERDEAVERLASAAIRIATLERDLRTHKGRDVRSRATLSRIRSLFAETVSTLSSADAEETGSDHAGPQATQESH